MQARKVPNCQVHLGDRPINITLQRALSSLSWWQTTKLTWHILTSRDPISKEEVEKCKQKDLLEDMLEEMTGEFPALSKVFVHERDLFLGMQSQNNFV
jgi:pheromone shutdown protein TraB